MSKVIAEKENEKVKSVIRFTQKRGAFLSVSDSKTDLVIGHTNGKEHVIIEGIPHDQRIEVLKAFDNFQALIDLNAHTGTLSRIFTRIPAALKSYMNQAFEVAEQHGLDFKPSRAIIRALTREITQTLNKVGIEPDLPEFKEPKTSKHIAAREIFKHLLPEKNAEDQQELKGFKAIFDHHALESFNKPPIELQYLFNYKYGKSKPPMWVYASALRTLHDLNHNIFTLGLTEELIFDLWYSAHKDLLDEEEIVQRFKASFKGNDKSLAALKAYIDQRRKNDSHLS